MQQVTIRIIAYCFVITGAVYFVGIPRFVDWVSAYTYTSPYAEPSLAEGYEVWGPFPLAGAGNHPAEGEVFVYKAEDAFVVRFVGLHMFGAPDMHVYVSRTLSGEDAVDLGTARAFAGSPSYRAPQGVDMNLYPYVLHMYAPTQELFNHAKVAVPQTH